MDNLIYEDNPWASRDIYWKLQYGYNVWLMQCLPVIFILFIAGVILASTQIEQEVVFKSIIALMVFIMYVTCFALRPTRYQIFNDRIRVVRGWVFHFDIPFSNIDNVTAAKSKDLGFLNLNFINSFSSDNILQITRKHGAKVNITPWDRTPFLENLNKAMADWNRIGKTE
jgi:hypothetical protein